MACCGGRGTKAKTAPSTVVRTASATLSEPLLSTDVRLVYTGANTGRETTYGKETGRRYKYGRSQRYIYLWVAAEDVAFLLSTKMFALAPVASAPAAVEVQAEEVQAQAAEPVEDTALDVPALTDVDPGTLTVAQIIEFDLEGVNVQAMLDAELLGKNRKSAVSYLQSVLDADATA